MTLHSSPASGIGLATYAGDTLLEAWFPSPSLEATPTAVDGLGEIHRSDDLRGVRTVTVTATVADLSVPPADAVDAWLRLHLLSHRLVAPRTVSLDGVSVSDGEGNQASSSVSPAYVARPMPEAGEESSVMRPTYRRGWLARLGA